MKKRSRLLKALKKLLCCCWCKTQQQDEEGEEYVDTDSPPRDEGKTEGVHEESGSLADSTSETAPSLPVMCGLTPECESDQSLPEECSTLKDPAEPEAEVQTSSEEDFLSASEGTGETPEGNTFSPQDVEEAEQAVLIDEPLIEKIYGLLDEPVKPSATEAPELVEEQGKAEGQTERRAARRRRRIKKKVQQEEEDNGGEWQLVCKKQRQKKTEPPAVQDRDTPAIKPAKPEPKRTPRKPKQPRRTSTAPQDERFRVRQSWQESTVKVAVQVPPDRRRYVIGTRGDALRQLQQQYPAVRVSVPGPQDLTSREVIIEGPKTQAEAAALHITRRLQAAEQQLREAEQRRQQRQRVMLAVEVPPDMRRHVVGPGGETLRTLTHQHPAVRVTVPPPTDTRTATVTVTGPRHQAAAAADCIRACVQAARRPQRQRQSRKRKQ